MSAHKPIDPWNNDQPTSKVDTPNRTSGTKPREGKSLTLPLIVGAIAVVVVDTAGFAMGDKNSESELASANEEIYSLQQQLEEQKSKLRTRIDELEDENSETHRKSLKSDQAAVTAYSYKRALDWLSVCDTRGYMSAEAGTKPTGWRSLGINYFYDFRRSGGEIVILVDGQISGNNSGECRNGGETGYLGSLQISRAQLNVWVSDSEPWADAEEKATDIAEKVSNATELNKKQGAEKQ